MEQKEKNMYDRITNQLVKSGYGDGQHHKVAEYLKEGKLDFPLHYTFLFSPDTLNLEPRFAPDESGRGPYLQEVHAVLNKGIEIPPERIGSVDTFELNNRFKNPPNPEFVTPDNQQEFIALQQAWQQQINGDMKILMEQKPETFVRFMEKYNPQLDFDIPPAIVRQRDQLREEHTISVTISSYYNLTPLEIYNALRFDRAINKDLFRKPKEGEPSEQTPDGKVKNISYNAWVKPNVKQPPDEKGRVQMQMWTKEWGFNLVRELNLYNFREMQSDNLGRSDKIYFMKKGVAVTFTNANSNGERFVKAIAMPGDKLVDLYKLSGERISNQKDYLKKPVISEAEQYRRNNNQQQNLIGANVGVQAANSGNVPSDNKTMSQGQENPGAQKQSDKNQNQTSNSLEDKKGRNQNKGNNKHEGNENKNGKKNGEEQRKHLTNDRTMSEEGAGLKVGR